MLEEDSDLIAVWCETHDDVTLIRQSVDAETVEFVQVKASEADQLWSPALLCRPGTGGVETSIFGRSLSQDRCDEPVSFRLVTARPMMEVLRVLELPLGSADRIQATAELEALKTVLGARAEGLSSPNGSTCDFWVDHAVIEVQHDLGRIQLLNEARIRRLAERAQEVLFSDQVTEIHRKLLGLVKRAAEAEWTAGGMSKKLTRDHVAEWFEQAVARAAHPARAGIGANLRSKMEAAGLGEQEIMSAADLRLAYRAEVLNPKYMGSEERRIVAGEVQVLLARQRGLLDAGRLQESGVQFHSRCLSEIHSLREALPELRGVGAPPPEQFLVGFMYNLVDRCPHHFVEATP
jgi:hypothetical protein